MVSHAGNRATSLEAVSSHNNHPHTHTPATSTSSAAATFTCCCIFVAMSGPRFRDKLKKAGKDTGKCLQKAAWSGCKYASWVCCSPCICGLIVFAGVCQIRKKKRKPRKGVRFKFPEVPFPRRRALTISSTDADWQEDQKTLDQSQSAFVHKLPLEIRRLIYKKALGEKSIHLGHSGVQMIARACPLVQCRCCQIYPDFERKLDFALPLLRTCRQM